MPSLANAQRVLERPQEHTPTGATLSLPDFTYHAKLTPASALNIDVVEARSHLPGATLRLRGSSNSNTVTLRSNQSGTNLRLRSQTRLLGLNDVIDLQRSDDGFWEEVLYAPGVKNAGTANTGAGVTAVEYAEGPYHITDLTLTDVTIPCVSVTSGNGVGGLLLYIFPEGAIVSVSCFLTGTLSIPTAIQSDYTDATPEGDIGIGTVSIANANTFDTDATDADISGPHAFTMDAYSAAISRLSTAADFASFDGTATAKSAYLNALVDAADIDDGTTSSLRFTGTVRFAWIYMGDD